MPPRKRTTKKKKTTTYEGLTSGQVEQLRDAFKLFDGNLGVIEKRELPFAMSAAGWKPEKKKIKEILATVNTEKEGEINDTVDFDEFVRLMTPTLQDQDESERYRVAFEMFDLDGKGYITQGDLKRVADEIGEAEMDTSILEEMIKEAGENSNQVTYEDFFKIMTFTEDTPL